jgi:catechol 2,3-dioxygenase-like lactoylglutathione lyase family enzyme
MIKGMHGLFYTPEAEATRAFLRDTLELPHVDAGHGWLIFRVPAGELGVHPGDTPKHELSFWCDDIEATVAKLEAKGVEFKSPIKTESFGSITTFEMPGGVEVALYQPTHPQP